MDLRLLLRVMWRFRFLVGLGLLCALMLSFLAVIRVDVANGSLRYRASEQWITYSRIFVTQPGFPYGEVRTTAGPPGALAANAIFYSQLALSDAVLRLAFGNEKPPGTLQAAPVQASASGSDALPIISIAGVAATAQTSKRLVLRETSGLIAYVGRAQVRGGIAPGNRVVLQVIQQPAHAALLKGRSKTLPVVVFLTGLFAVIGLALILENLRPAKEADEMLPTLAVPEGAA